MSRLTGALVAMDAQGLLLVNSCLEEEEGQAYSSTLCNR